MHYLKRDEKRKANQMSGVYLMLNKQTHPTHACIHMHTHYPNTQHAHTCAHTHAHMSPVHMHVRACTCSHTFKTCACTHIHTCSHMHTYVLAYICTHGPTQSQHAHISTLTGQNIGTWVISFPESH